MSSNRARHRRRLLLYIRQRGACAICGGYMHITPEDIKAEPHYMATIDHIKRVRDGGGNDMPNLRAVHKFCNEKRD